MFWGFFSFLFSLLRVWDYQKEMAIEWRSGPGTTDTRIHLYATGADSWATRERNTVLKSGVCNKIEN